VGKGGGVNDLNGVFVVDFMVEELIEWACNCVNSRVSLALDPELGMNSVDFKEHLVFCLVKGFRDDLRNNILRVRKIQFKKVENGIQSMWIGQRSFSQRVQSCNKQVHQSPKMYKLPEILCIFLKRVNDQLFHSLLS
jgi:hypothetical protein